MVVPGKRATSPLSNAITSASSSHQMSVSQLDATTVCSKLMVVPPGMGSLRHDQAAFAVGVDELFHRAGHLLEGGDREAVADAAGVLRPEAVAGRWVALGDVEQHG